MLFFIPLSAAGDPLQPVARLDFQAFVARVDGQHPEGAAEREALAASRAALGGVGILPDPMFAIGREGVPGDDPRWTASLSQSFPWPGALSAEDRAAEAEVERETAGVELGRVSREFLARHTYLRLVEKAKVLEAATENLAQTEKLLAFSEAQFKHGIGSHTEFLQAVSDSRILRANVDSLKAELEDLNETAKAMIDLPEGLPVEFVFEFPPDLVAPAAPESKGPERDAQAAALAAESRRIQAEKDSERLKTMPSISVSAMMMRSDEGMKSFGGTAGISLPLYSGIRRGALAEERDHRAASQLDEIRWYQKRKLLATSRIRRAIRQNGENIRVLHDEIIPFTTEHSRSALVAYQQGRGPLSAVVAGRSAVLGLNSAEISARAALAVARCAENAVQRGMLDAAELVEIPPLPSASLGGMTGMSGMGKSGKMRGGRLPSLEPNRPAAPGGATSSSPEQDDAKPSGGMGM